MDGHLEFNGDPATDVDDHLGITVAHSEVVQAHRGAVETLPRVTLKSSLSILLAPTLGTGKYYLCRHLGRQCTYLRLRYR
jgi:hypothetical protein